MSAAWCKPHEIKGDSGILLRIHAQPGASKTRIQGLHGDRLKVAVQAPPVEGAANEALIRFFADALGIPASRIHLVRGETSRQKTFFLTGISESEVTLRLNPS